MCTAAIALSPRRLRVALALAVVVLAVGAQVAHAGTWYINPLITNGIGSGDTSQCYGHSNWAGCVLLESSAMTELSGHGDWANDPYANPGVQGGRSILPAACNPPNSSCGGTGNSAPNIDQPSFDAPDFGYGTSGTFVYATPDGNGFGLTASDENQEYGPIPACVVGAPFKDNDYACDASFAPGSTPGCPNSSCPESPFNPHFTFFDASDWENHVTGAGEVCTVPGGSKGFVCAAGESCTTSGACESLSQSGPGAQWGSTDPWQYMYVGFYDSGGDGPVTVTDAVANTSLDANDRIVRSPGGSCTMQQRGDVCWLVTSGGSWAYNGYDGGAGKWPEALSVTYAGDGSGGPPAQVKVLGVSEIDEFAAQERSRDWSLILTTLLTTTAQDFGNAGGDAVTSLPLLRRLDARSAHGGTTLSYRDPTGGATTVVSLARGTAGVRAGGLCVGRASGAGAARTRCTRWERLPSARVRAGWDEYYARHGHACRASYASRLVVDVARGSRCHLSIKPVGDLIHRDRVRANAIDITRINGHRLRAGRYRATVLAIKGRRVSRPARVEFKVRG